MKVNYDVLKFAVILVAVLIGGGIYLLQGGEKKIEPGACTDGADSSIEIVDCDDSEAEYKVVSRLGTTADVSAEECEVGEAYSLKTEANETSILPVWCLVDADDDSPEVEQAIEEAKEEEGDE